VVVSENVVISEGLGGVYVIVFYVKGVIHRNYLSIKLVINKFHLTFPYISSSFALNTPYIFATDLHLE